MTKHYTSLLHADLT